MLLHHSDLHKRKLGLSCPFFLAPKPADYAESSSSSKAETPGIRMVTEEDEPSEESSVESLKAAKAASKKGKSTATVKGKKESKVKPKELDYEEIEVEEPQPKSRSRSNSQSQPPATTSNLGRSTRTRTTLSTIAGAPSSDAGPAVEVAPTKASRATRTKKASQVPTTEPIYDNDVFSDPAPAVPIPQTATSKSTRSRANSVLITDTPSSSLGLASHSNPTTAKTTRSRASSVVEESAPTRTGTRSRASSIAEESAPMIPPPTAATGKKVAKTTTLKTKNRVSKMVVEEQVVEQEVVLVEQSESFAEPESSKPKKGRGKSSMASIKSKKAASMVVEHDSPPRAVAPVLEEAEEEEAEEEAVVVAQPKTKTKKKKSGKKTTSSKAASIVIAEDEVEEMEVEPTAPTSKPNSKPKGIVMPLPEDSPRAVLSPTVASPSPRPIKGLPLLGNARSPRPSPSPSSSKPNSFSNSIPNSTTLIPLSISTPYVAPPNPFSFSSSTSDSSGPTSPKLTEEELSMTVGEYYEHQRSIVAEKLRKELRRETEAVERRFEMGFAEAEKVLGAVRESALRGLEKVAKEGREGRSPR
ncbi:hypothetical protein P7C70_g9215, partial [Phenoliferia sp. Uapishka_3]